MRYTHALVSRPRPQLDELAARLEAAGVSPVALPAFRFEAQADRVAADAAWRDRDTRLLIFTSPRAVTFGLPALDTDMLAEARIAAIGPATARALADAGLEPLQASGPRHDSETLLDHLDALLPPGAAVIFAAPGGREALEQGLRSRGWAVRLVPVYRRVAIAPDPAQVARLERADSVVSFWTSTTAMEHLLESLTPMARERVLDGTAIVVSERLAGVARSHGFREVHTAGGASNRSLLAAFESVSS